MLVPLVLLLPVIPLPVTIGLRPRLGISLGVVAVAVVALVALLVVGYRRRLLGRVWSSEPIVWLGRTVLAAAAVASSVELARDVSSIL